MRKILVFFLVFMVGNGLLLSNTAQAADVVTAQKKQDPRVVIVKENKSNSSRQNYFTLSVIGEYYDMLNEMFKTSASLEVGWLYAFNDKLFVEVGMSWTILGPDINDAAVFLGLGFTPLEYYHPEIIFMSKFLKLDSASDTPAAADIKLALRNNIKLSTTGVGVKLFSDIGVSIKEGDFAQLTAFLTLGVGLEI